MVVTYRERVLSIKLYDTLITWSYKITWQTKTIACPLPQSLWPLKLKGWYELLLIKSFNPLIIWSYEVTLETKAILYLHHCSACGHQNWQNAADLSKEVPTHKISWLFSHMILQNHLTNWSISPTQSSYAH